MRRGWRRDLTAAQEAEAQCQTRFEQLAEPERTKLTAALRDAEADAQPLRRQADDHRTWLRSHPDVTDRIRRIDHELTTGAPVIKATDAPRVSRTPPTQGVGIEL